MVYRYTAFNCPKCGHKLDAAGVYDDPDGRDPRAGDASICIECSNVMIFRGDPPTPDIPTPEEQLTIMNDPDTMKALISLALFRKNRLQ